MKHFSPFRKSKPYILCNKLHQLLKWIPAGCCEENKKWNIEDRMIESWKWLKVKKRIKKQKGIYSTKLSFSSFNGDSIRKYKPNAYFSRRPNMKRTSQIKKLYLIITLPLLFKSYSSTIFLRKKNPHEYYIYIFYFIFIYLFCLSFL